MKAYPDIPTLGVVAYLQDPLAGKSSWVVEAVQSCLARLTTSLAEVSVMAQRVGGKQRPRWKRLTAEILSSTIEDDEVADVNLLIGSPEEVKCAAHLALRSRTSPRDVRDGPFELSVLCETSSWQPDLIASTWRELLASACSQSNLLSGGIFRTPTMLRAFAEIDHHITVHGQVDPYPCPAGDLPFDRWTKARRLYPITLLGPKLASQLSAADALAAGALSVQELNGSLLIDAYPTVVETWDPEYLRATVTLRKWLWPHTIQNPTDAVGLGLKLPRR